MRDQRRGLSFLEVTVVILVIGLLAAIATPQYARFARKRSVRNAAIEMAGYVDYIRDVAINEGRSTSLSIDAATDRFSSPDVDFPDRIGTLISLPLKQRFDASLELSGAFDATNSMSFNLEGTPFATGTPLTTGVIAITSHDVRYEIRVAAGQGNVTIVETDPDSQSFVAVAEN